MKIVCDNCRAEFRLAAEKLKPGDNRLKCARCGHVFVYNKEAGTKPSPAAPHAEAGPVQAQAGPLQAQAGAAPAEDGAPPAEDGMPPVEDGVPPTEDGVPAPSGNAAGSDHPPPVYYIVRDDQCPLYERDDEFQFADGVFFVPNKKAPCMILARDVRRIQSLAGAPEVAAINTCSGCSGRILFALKSELSGRPENYMDALVRLLGDFPIFEGLEKREILDIAANLRLDRFATGDYVLRKGEPGRNLFIILSGRVDVLSDDRLVMAAIGKGEVFGEMSVLSGSPVGAAIRVAAPTNLLRISAEHFRRVLNGFPSLQMRFTRLLVERMREINKARSEQYASSLAGKLSEIPPPDLFQTFYINQKTGVLTLKLPYDTASLSFRDGRLVDVVFGKKRGEEAFFDLLKLKHGQFRYLPGLPEKEMNAQEIGDFMFLIIEGLRRIEQDDRDFLKTVMPTLV